MGRQTVTPVSDQPARPESMGNLFLDSLSPSIAKRLFPLLKRAPLKAGRQLAEPGVPFDEVYFPIQSLISTIARMSDGAAVEVGLSGREGMSPISAAFGDRVGPHTVIVQIPDSAWCMSAQSLLQEIERDADLRSRALDYARYAFAAAAQFAACNRLHTLESRYARWLLMASDRVAQSSFTLTQEYSAEMLGVRRAGVSVAAGELSNAGLISRRRNHVTLLDRAGLEETACECYAVVNGEAKRVMGYDIQFDETKGLVGTTG